MSRVYECDICKENTTDPFWAKVAYERTQEEVTNLLAMNDRTEAARDEMREASIVAKEFDLCEKCHRELKQKYA